MSRTGTFLTIHCQLERLKTEGVVDFLQAIKSARLHRPGLVNNTVSLLIFTLTSDVLCYLDLKVSWVRIPPRAVFFLLVKRTLLGIVDLFVFAFAFLPHFLQVQRHKQS